MQTSKFIIVVTHDKPIADLGDRIAGRVWSMDGVRAVEAKVVIVPPPAPTAPVVTWQESAK